MKRKNFLSIIIPTLNEEKYLPDLLSSLASQTVKDFEVIVSEGKSIDKTRKKANEFKNKLDIKIHDSDKRHLAYQRNFGAKKAKGNYLFFLDADFSLEKDFIEKVYKFLEKKEADFLVPYGHPDRNSFLKAYFVLMNVSSNVSRFIFRKPFATISAAVIKTDLFNRLGGYDELVQYAEDQEILQRAHKNKAKIKYFNIGKVIFSIRRIEKEGFKYFYKNLFAVTHIIFLGKMKKNLIKHEMGGHEFLKHKN
ncbi:MAG: glycosyltransferase [Patescibacteria group bacterium]|nr:glycosyltransferase [Patescibacteria group bacterium]